VLADLKNTTRKQPFSGRKKRPENLKTGKISGGHDQPQNRAPVALTGGFARRKITRLI
jgi:hypothetical protein